MTDADVLPAIVSLVVVVVVGSLAWGALVTWFLD